MRPNEVKAFLLLGLFRGRLPEPGRPISLTITSEAMARLGNLDDVTIEARFDPASLQMILTATRTPILHTLEAAELRALATEYPTTDQ